MVKKKKNDITIRSSAAEYLTFIASTGDDRGSFEMRYQEENIWLTQKMMAELYDVSIPAINQHIKRIFHDGELVPESVIKEYLITADDGKNYKTKHYNLQMTIAVGFKVNNDRAVRFRKWAGKIVKDYTIQGWLGCSQAHSCMRNCKLNAGYLCLWRIGRRDLTAFWNSTAMKY